MSEHLRVIFPFAYAFFYFNMHCALAKIKVCPVIMIIKLSAQGLVLGTME